MSVVVYTAETGVAAGTDISTINSGNNSAGPAFSAITKANAGTAKFQTGSALGALNMEFIAATATAVARVDWNDLFNTSVMVWDVVFKMNWTSSGSTNTIVELRTGSSAVARVSVIDTAIRLVDQNNTTIASTTISNVTYDAWHRFQFCVQLGATASSGQVRLIYYADPLSTTATTDTGVRTGINLPLNSAPMTVARLGKTSSASTGYVAIDNIRYNDASFTAFADAPASAANSPTAVLKPTIYATDRAFIDARNSTLGAGSAGTLTYSINPAANEAITAGFWDVDLNTTYTITVTDTSSALNDSETVVVSAAQLASAEEEALWNGSTWQVL